jgi:hypothetical protein
VFQTCTIAGLPFQALTFLPFSDPSDARQDRHLGLASANVKPFGDPAIADFGLHPVASEQLTFEPTGKCVFGADGLQA